MRPAFRHRPRTRRALGPLLAALVLAFPSGAPLAKIRWSDFTLDDAIFSASKSQTPLFLVFGAEWCGFCRMMDQTTLRSGAVETSIDPYLPLRFDVDTEAGRAAASRYAVVGLPTVLALDPKGHVSARHSGYMTEQELARFLDDSRLSTFSSEALIDKARAPDAPTDLLARVGNALVDLGREEEGRVLLQRAAAGQRGSSTVSRALLSLATLDARREGPEAALPSLARVAGESADPEVLKEAYTTWIRLLRDLRRRDEQMHAWSEFASRLPDDPVVQEDYARALIEANAPPERILEAAGKAEKADPRSGGPKACRAEALYRLGRYQEAFDAVVEAIRADPNDPAPRVLRLRLMEKLRAPTPSAGRK